ncbi:hypothetical protein ACVXHB_10985 [Escherichia coli]
MLTRENMLNGTFVRVHEALLANMLWDAENMRINELYSGGAPTGAPVRIFADGLSCGIPCWRLKKWNGPSLKGWQRSFCIRLYIRTSHS